MMSLNNDILSLNLQIQNDQLQLDKDNALVKSILFKIDIISSFIRMMNRVLEKVTQHHRHHNQSFSKIYYTFIQNTSLTSILIRVMGISIQVPNSPNNNSIICMIGCTALDNIINQVKTSSLMCINFILKKKDILSENKNMIVNGM